MSHATGVVVAGIFVLVAAGVAIYGSVKRRPELMMWALTAMMIFQGVQQRFGKGTLPRWVAYCSFGIAAIGAAAILVRRARAGRAK